MLNLIYLLNQFAQLVLFYINKKGVYKTENMSRTINSTTMKKINRGLVFKNLVINPEMSRAELARKLPLTKMTITNIVTEFLERELIVEQEKIILGEPHKNPIRIDLSEKCPRIIGVQIQRSYCKVVLTDFRQNVLESREVQYKNICLDMLKRVLNTLIGELLENGNVMGIGVGSIGPIDSLKGIICSPPNFGDIQDFAITDYLEKKFHIPVVLEHHYNCAVLAEHYFGTAVEINNLIYLGITQGVGMGGLVNGKLYSSFFGNNMEIGHVSVEREGKLCRCGNRGCMETYVSTNIITEELRRLTGEKKSFREFCQTQDRPEITEYFFRVMDYLKVALIDCMNIFQPEMIIIGDDGYFLPDECIQYLEKEVNRIHLYKKQLYVRILKTSIRDSELLTASATMGVIEKVFQGELLFD